MDEKPASSPARDWRDENAYVELEKLDRRGFAWEYLRRNPDYRRLRTPDGAAQAEIVGGISIIRTSSLAVPPIWGLRFRGVTGNRCADGEDLLG